MLGVVAVDGVNQAVIHAELSHLTGGRLHIDDGVCAGVDAVFNKGLGGCIVLQGLGEDELDVVSGGDEIFQVSAAGGNFVVGLGFGNADDILLGSSRCSGVGSSGGCSAVTAGRGSGGSCRRGSRAAAGGQHAAYQHQRKRGLEQFALFHGVFSFEFVFHVCSRVPGTRYTILQWGIRTARGKAADSGVRCSSRPAAGRSRRGCPG